MGRWLCVSILCTLWVLSCASRASPAVFDEAAPVLGSSRVEPNGGAGVLTGSGRWAFHKTSGKARRIASRLDATGYYSYLSRAMKGYPNLRSRTSYRKGARTAAVHPENRKRFTGHVEKIARIYKLDPGLIDAVISVESAYDPEAVSNKGALGLMQLMPDTAKRFDVSDPLDPVANMHGGARYLRWLMDRFDSDLDLVLAAYNAGEGALEEHGNRIPPYEETRTYVARVRNLYEAKHKAP
jgi:soluble lytic murein transglycosylase-like protein